LRSASSAQARAGPQRPLQHVIAVYDRPAVRPYQRQVGRGRRVQVQMEHGLRGTVRLGPFGRPGLDGLQEEFTGLLALRFVPHQGVRHQTRPVGRRVGGRDGRKRVVRERGEGVHMALVGCGC
jgi:hypothetical protein